LAIWAASRAFSSSWLADSSRAVRSRTRSSRQFAGAIGHHFFQMIAVGLELEVIAQARFH